MFYKNNFDALREIFYYLTKNAGYSTEKGIISSH